MFHNNRSKRVAARSLNVFVFLSQIVFRYERGDGPTGLVALDDISFSRECVFDPDNNKLPDTTTSAPPTSSNTPTSPATPSTSTVPTHPCQVNTRHNKLMAAKAVL